MAEAAALVRTLDGWSVAETVVVPTKVPDRKLVFGKGTLERLTGGSRARASLSFLRYSQEDPHTHRLSLCGTEAASGNWSRCGKSPASPWNSRRPRRWAVQSRVQAGP